MHVVGYFIAGLIAGLIVALVMKARGTSLFGYALVGIIGSYLGGMLLDSAGLTFAGQLGSYVAATGGAVVLLIFIEFMKNMQ